MTAVEQEPRRGGWGIVVVPILVLTVAIVVLLYPVVATLRNNAAHAEFARRYNTQMSTVPGERLGERRQEARDYASTLSGVPILDPYLTSLEASHRDPDYTRYLSLLNDGEVMARVQIVRLGIDLPVRHGTNEDALGHGVGHLYGTALPVGGAGTHSVLTSHTGYASSSLFDNLHRAARGDIVQIDVYGDTLYYEVDGIETVLPDVVAGLGPIPGEDRLTLFTCTPYGVNSHRLMVHAHRISAEQAASASTVAPQVSVLQPWMVWHLAGAGVALLLGVGIVVREWRRRSTTALSEQ